MPHFAAAEGESANAMNNAQNIANGKLPRWTQAEDAFLRAQWSAGISMLTIAGMMHGKTRCAVACRISRLGLKLSPRERHRRISTGSAIGGGKAT